MFLLIKDIGLWVSVAEVATIRSGLRWLSQTVFALRTPFRNPSPESRGYGLGRTSHAPTRNPNPEDVEVSVSAEIAS